MNKYIDTHAHYQAKRFNKDRKELLNQLKEELLAIINIGTDTKLNLETLQLVSLYDFIYGMIGFFPTNTWMLEKSLCKEAEDNWIILTKQILNQKIIGIGEIGLDYHWNSIGTSSNLIKGEKAREIQKKWFRKQIELALSSKLPISIHSRDAKKDTMKILKDYPELKGVMHCFSYDKEIADFLLNSGFYLGVGGTLTYPSNHELREIIKECPLNRILLETDAPYLSPQPVRKERNQSNYISYVIEFIAELKQISIEKVIEETNKNIKNLINNQNFSSLI